MGAEPKPLVGWLTVSQLVALLVAVHAQPAPAVRWKEPLLACSLTDTPDVSRE
jgi:hypothetical protein